MTNIANQKQEPAPSVLAKVMELRACCERMQSELDRAARVSAAQCAVLRAMPESEALLTGELCLRVGLSASRGGRVIEELVQAGWAQRLPDASDRRASRVRLTSEGQERRRQVESLLQACEGALFEQLGLERLGTIEASLDVLLGAMRTLDVPTP